MNSKHQVKAINQMVQIDVYLSFAVNVIRNLFNDCHLILLAIRYQFRSSDEGRPDSRRRIVRSPSFVKSLPSQVYEIDEKGKLQEQVRMRIDA